MAARGTRIGLNECERAIGEERRERMHLPTCAHISPQKKPSSPRAELIVIIIAADAARGNVWQVIRRMPAQ